MPPHLDAHRRLLASRGRAMTLRRITAIAPSVTRATVSLTGFSRAYRPDPLAGALVQAGLVIEIGQDEIDAASWPGPPRPQDDIVDGGAVYSIEGVETLHEGATVIGHRLLVRGGS